MTRPWLLALALLAAPASAQAPGPLRFEDAGDADAMARRLGLAAGRTILVAPGVEASAPLSVEAATWREAVAALASAVECEALEVDDRLVVLRPPATVSLSFAGADARSALQLLTACTGRDLVVDATVPFTPVTLELAAVRWDEALAAIAHACGLAVEVDGDLVRVGRGPAGVRVGAALPAWLRPAWSGARLLEGPTVAFEGADARALAAAAAEAGGASLLLDPRLPPLVEATGWEPLPWRAALTRLALRSGWRVAEERGVVVVRAPLCPSLQLGGVEARAALDALAAQAGLALVVEPGVEGELTIDLEGLAADEALAAVAAAAGAEVEDEGDLVVVRPRGAPARPRRAWRAAGDGPTVDLEAGGRPLAEVLAELGRQAGVAIDAAWPPAPRPPVAHGRLRGVPWQVALELLTGLHRCEVLPVEGGLRVEPPPGVRLAVGAGADLAVVTSALAARIGLAVALDEGLPAAAPALDVRVGSWRRALEALALSLGADLVDDGPGGVRVARRAGGPAPPAAPVRPWSAALESFGAALRAESGPALDELLGPPPAPAAPAGLRDLLLAARQRLEAGAAEEAVRLCDLARERAEGSPALEALVEGLRGRARALQRIQAAALRPAALLFDERAGTAEALVAGRAVRAGDELLVGDLPVKVLGVERELVRLSALDVAFERERAR